MPKKKTLTGPQSRLAEGMYGLDQRRLLVWVPFLEKKIAELQARIQEKQTPGQEQA